MHAGLLGLELVLLENEKSGSEGFLCKNACSRFEGIRNRCASRAGALDLEWGLRHNPQETEPGDAKDKSQGFHQGLDVGRSGLLGLVVGRAAHAQGGGGVAIDPPPGELFRDPGDMENLTDTPGIVEVAVEPQLTPVNLQGTTVDLLTYSRAFPGPTIRVKKGDLLKIRFRNSLPPTSQPNALGFTGNVTNLHTHGWHVSPSGNSDNIFLLFAPGEEYEFVYDTSRLEAGTLGWYHPHAHGRVADQLSLGLAGALIVEDETPLLSVYETHLLVVKDFDVSNSRVEPLTRFDFVWGKEGQTVTVNGQVNPVLPIRPGQVQRWRVLNASTARFYKLALENHTLNLVGTDGNLLDRPYPVPELLLAPGERADLLVHADQPPGSYRLRSLPYDRGANIPETITLMTMPYEGSRVEEALPGVISPNAGAPE